MHWLAACFGLVLTLGISIPMAAHSHAAVIEVETAQAIRLHARYDTGAPMAHAQVIIYAPNTPSKVWGQGVADRDGRFEFIPDAIEGAWAIQIRQAGHGVSTSVEIGGTDPAIFAPPPAQTWTQRALMVALVAWGALGTGLYVRARKGGLNASA
jgi:nickel transport protein